MKTLIHLTTDDDEDAAFALACGASLMRHGGAVALLLHREAVRIGGPASPYADRLRTLADEGGEVIVSAGCLRARDLPLEVVDGARLTDAGSVECTTLQADGYALVKIP